MGYFDTKTALDIIVDAMTVVGELPQGNVPSAEDAAFCLDRLNSMLDSWATEGLSSYTTNIFTGQLGNLQQDYIMGQDTSVLNPDFLTQRPVLIQQASLVAPFGGNSAVEFPMNILDVNRWLSITERSKTGYIPQDIYVDQGYPNAGVHVHPVPLAWPALGAPKIRLAYWSILAQFVALDVAFSFPPGYHKAIVNNLAVELLTGYNKPPDQTLMMNALQGKNFMQALNAQVQSSFGESRTLNNPHLGKMIPPSPASGGNPQQGNS